MARAPLPCDRCEKRGRVSFGKVVDTYGRLTWAYCLRCETRYFIEGPGVEWQKESHPPEPGAAESGAA